MYTYSGEWIDARGDDYPAHYKNGNQEIDKWRMYSRQCTSFAAFRLSSVNGFEIPAGAYWKWRTKTKVTQTPMRHGRCMNP